MLYFLKIIKKILLANLSIHVINLDKDKDRLEKLLSHIKMNNLTFNRYSAINGKQYYKYNDLDKKYISKKFKKKYTDSQKACLLSHVDLWDKIKNDNHYNLILEDDAILPEKMLLKINKVMKELPDDWGFLFLGGNKIFGYKYSKHLITPKVSNIHNFGAFGYIINPKKIIEILERCKNIKVTIDWFIQSQLSKYFKIFFAYPQIITHDYDNISNLTNKNRINETNSNNKIIIIDNIK